MPYLKMLWQTDTPTPTVGSWDFWITRADDRPYNEYHTIKKVNNKICYYGSFIRINTLTRDTLVISPDSDAVTMCHWHGTPVYTYTGTITDSNGIIWYYTHIPDDLYNPSGESMIYDISSKRYGSNIQQAAQDLLDRIYAVPFHEDYQPSGYNYITVPAGDIRKTVRKALGLHLAFNVQYYSTNSNYQALSDGVDGMIDDIVNNDRSVNGNIHIQINPRYTTSYATRTIVRYMTDNRSLTVRINAKEIYNNLPYYQTTYNSSMNYYEREYQNATYRYYGSSAISGGLIGVRCFDKGDTLSANNAGIDL